MESILAMLIDDLTKVPEPLVLVLGAYRVNQTKSIHLDFHPVRITATWLTGVADQINGKMSTAPHWLFFTFGQGLMRSPRIHV